MALNETDLLAKVPTGLFIGGKWVQGHGEKPIAVEDPATGKTLLEIANADGFWSLFRMQPGSITVSQRFADESARTHQRYFREQIGRDPRFQAAAQAYCIFLDALADGARPGRLQKLLETARALESTLTLRPGPPATEPEDR